MLNRSACFGTKNTMTPANPRTDRNNWWYRVVAFTLFVSLLVGSLLGMLTAWMVNAPLVDGMLGGGTTGGVFSLLMSGILISAGRKQQPPESVAHLD